MNKQFTRSQEKAIQELEKKLKSRRQRKAAERALLYSKGCM